MDFQKIIKKASKANKNGFITALALIFIAISQVPQALKNSAELFCIGQASNRIWLIEKNHSKANMIAVQSCNGKNRIE